MKRKVRFPISFKFTLFILLAVMLHTSLMVGFESRLMRENYFDEKRLDLQVSMAGMQHSLEFLLRNEHLNEAQQTVTSLGADPRLNLALLLDPEGNILASSRMELIGHHINGQIDDGIRKALESAAPQIKSEYKLKIWEDEYKHALYAVAPIDMRVSNSVYLPSNETGLLVVWLDTRWIDSSLNDTLVSELVPASLLLVILGALIIWIFHVIFSRRIRIILEAANKFTLGTKNPVPPLAGYDELSELASSFNDMASEINVQHERLRDINDSLHRTQEIANIGTWELDLTGNSLYWSDEVYRIFGYKPQEFPANYQAFLDAVHPGDRDMVNHAYTSSLKTGARKYEIEHRVVQKNTGAVRYVHEKCEHVRDGDGKVIMSRGMVQDITARKQIEKALQQSEVHFRSIINASPVPFALNDNSGNILYLNPAFTSTFGYDLMDIPTLTEWWARAYPDENYRQQVKWQWQQNMETSISTGKPFEAFEVHIICKDGSQRTVLAEATSLADNFKGVHLVILYDISERKLAQMRVTDSEQRLRLATEAAEIGIWQWNVKTNRIHWDAQMFRMYGLPPTADGFVDYADWSLSVVPEDLPAQEAMLNETVRTAGRGKREYRIYRRNDRAMRTIQAFDVVRTDNTGAAEWVIGTNLDITERKQAELRVRKQKEEQQTILNSMIDAVITIDEEGTILTYNTAAEVMFGYMAEEAIGRNVNILMPDDIAKQHDGYLRAYINGGPAKVVGIGRELTARRKTGERFPLRLSVADLPRGQNELRRFVGTCHETTQEKQQQEIIKRTQKMDALGKLTGGVAHDFNNMLGVILGYAEMLQSALENDPKKSKYVREIYLAGERAKKLTSKLLVFSRKTSGDMEIVDLNNVLRDTQHMLEKTLTARIQLILNLANDVWPVLLDKSGLEDAVLNMSINAMHAMPHGGKFTVVTENVSLGEADAGLLQLTAGDYVELSLIDTGMGMDEDTRQRMFDPFFSTKGEMGTGLGMSQVYGFVQQSRGAITVESAPGRGTRISIYIPRHIGKTNHVAANGESAGIKKPSGSGIILVVDDEKSLAAMAAEILESHGYRVFTANSGIDALKILEQEPVDLVLSDIVMPGMDGYQLATQIAQQYPAIKIQLTSGYTDQRDPGAHTELHKNRLHKPYTSAVLLQTVKALLEQ
jgi:PAS domain S-box-containing protein